VYILEEGYHAIEKEEKRVDLGAFLLMVPNILMVQFLHLYLNARKYVKDNTLPPAASSFSYPRVRIHAVLKVQ
jgi:hypothetical protein